MSNEAVRQSIEILTGIIRNQDAVQKKLIKLEKEKTQILLKGTPDDLDSVLNSEQALLMQSESFERQRTALQKSMGTAGWRLKEILEHCSQEEKYSLEPVYLQLKQSLHLLRKANELNRRVIAARLESKEQMLKLMGIGREAVTYTR